MYRVVPGHTSLIVILDLLSQISLILAFFLPLKVIILLGSPDLPEYFPSSWHTIERDRLVVLLSLSAAVAYLFYAIVDKLVTVLTEQAAVKILRTKPHLLEDIKHETMTKLLYGRYVKIVSSLLFSLIAIISIAFIYTSLLLPLSVFCLIAGCVVYFIIANRRKVNSNPFSNINVIITTIGALGFLSMFAFMVSDFIILPAPGVIAAVIGLLLVRQLFSRLVVFVVNTTRLIENKPVVNTLFFNQIESKSIASVNEKSAWEMVHQEQRENWIHPILKKHMDSDTSALKIECIELGEDGVVAMIVTNLLMSSNSHHSRLLLKLYDKKCSQLSRQESILLQKNLVNHLWPKMLATYKVGDFNCHVYEWRSSEILPESEYLVRNVEILDTLMSTPVSKKLLREFDDSRFETFGSLDETTLRRLYLCASPPETDLLDTLVAIKPKIMKIWRSSPKQIVNPDITKDNVLVTDDKRVFTLHWGRWSLQSVGSGLFINPEVYSKLPQIFISAKQSREDLKTFSLNTIRLNACVYEFEKLCAMHKYNLALKVLPELVEHASTHE